MHFLNRKLFKLMARLILAAILFLQYSLATQACVLSDGHPAKAFNPAVAMADCAMHPLNKANPNACFVHCTASDQTLDTHQPLLAVTTAIPVDAWVSSFPATSLPSHRHPAPLLAFTSGPPYYLLFQNFRN